MVYSPGAKTDHFGAQPTDLYYIVVVSLHDANDGDGPENTAETPPFPLAVSDVTGVSTGSTLTISWAPNFDDVYVDGYTVTLAGAGLGAPITVSADSSDESYPFLDIPVGTYTATVAAQNVSGDGPTATGDVTADGKDVPGAPTNLAATDASNDGVRFTWDPPVSGGGLPATNYDIVIQTPGISDPYDDPIYGELYQDSTVSPRSWTFYGIPVGTHYVITVYEANDRGDGPAVSTPTRVKVASTVAAPPTNVTAVSSSPNQVTATWAAPTDNGGQPVTDYIVTVNDGNPASVSYATGDQRSATLNNIKAGTFGVTVTAYNSNGQSAPGTATVTVSNNDPVVVPPVTPVPPVVTPVPGVPLHLHASRVKKGGVTTINWDAPKAVAGAPVQRYVVVVDGYLTIVKGGVTLVTVRGLRAGPAKVTVQAVNKNGVSKAAVTSITVAKSVALARQATLKLGMKGAAVKHLQIALGMRHHNGTFAASTRVAVIAWQRSHGAHRTGAANDRMRFLLGV